MEFLCKHLFYKLIEFLCYILKICMMSRIFMIIIYGKIIIMKMLLSL